MISITTLMSIEKANKLAETMTAEDDDGWEYIARHCPTGKGSSFVEIFDDEGLIGTL